MLSDAELVATSGRDPEAFRTLYDRHAESIHCFFVRRTSDHEAALDLTAETFAQAWASRHRFADQRDGSAAPWLFGIAGNLLARSARERRLVREATDALRLRRTPTTAVPDQSWVDGMDADLERALAELPPSQRQAVELRVVHDLAYEAVADQLEISPTAARIRVSRGLSRLRTSIDTPTLPSTKEAP